MSEGHSQELAGNAGRQAGASSGRRAIAGQVNIFLRPAAVSLANARRAPFLNELVVEVSVRRVGYAVQRRDREHNPL